MVHPGLAFIKQINSDKFDAKSFIVGHLEEFFKQLALYIQSIHKYDKKKDTITPSKRINGLMIVNSLEKILPNVKQSDIQNNSVRDIDTIFSFLLHPDTPSDVRLPSSTLFKNFAKKLDDIILSQLNVSFYFLIPFSRLTRNDEEYQSIIKNYNKTVCGLNSGGNPINIEEAYTEAAGAFQFIADLYLLRNVKSPIQFLFNDVFPTIYFKQIQNTGYQIKKEGGFNSPSPSRLQNEVLKFFELVRQSKCNLLPFGDTKEKIKILLTIISDSCGQNGEENAELTFSVMNIFTQEPLFGNFKIQSQIYPLIDIVFNLMKSFSLAVKKKSSTKASAFLSNLMYSEFISMSGEDLALNILTYVYQKASIESQIIIAQDSALLFLINNKVSNQRIWEFIIKQIKTSPIAAIASCRFSMYIATLIFPLFYKFNIDEAIEACSNISFRSKRNRLKNDYDFVAEYIGLACKEPTKFVSDCFEIGFQPLAQYISNFEGFPFPEIRNVPTNLENITVLKNFFFSHFDIFNFDNLNENEQNNLFSITFAYYYTLLKLHRFPPEIKFDRAAYFYNYGNKLIEFCLKDNLTLQVKLSTFSLLSESINDRFFVDKLNSSILTHWYIILYLNILNKNEEISEEAFISATKTLRIGFLGSSILVPLLIFALKNGLVTSLVNMKPDEKRDRITSLIDKKIGSVMRYQSNDENSSNTIIRAIIGNKSNNTDKYMKDKNGDLANPVISFLSMGPLFQRKIIVPETFLNFVRQKCTSSPQLFNSKSIGIIDHISIEKVDYKTDIIDCFMLFKNCCSVVTASSVLIVNELVKDTPDIEFINKLIHFYVDPIVNNHSVETLNCLMGMMDYFTHLEKLCKDSVLNLLNLFTEEVIKITYNDDPDWIYASITTLMTLFIHTYSISKETNNSEKFCTFLSNFSSQRDDSKNCHENLILLSQNALDMMSVYYGCYPFPNTPLFPSSMDVCSDKENFYYIGNHTLIHASTKQNQNQNNDEVRIDVINEIGKFSYSFSQITNILLDDEKINDVDIPIINEKEESIQAENKYKSEVIDPPNNLISNYEKEERNGEKFISDIVNIKDPEIQKNMNEINDSFSTLKTGKLENIKIRPYLNCNKILSGYSPLSIFNLINFSNKEKIKRIENSKASKILLDKIENHSHRIKMKIGVVYVGLHKDDQDQIFSTKLEDTSNQFKEFLNGLGYPVFLSSHSMYNGGLDLKGGRSGKTSIYYANFSNEIMFHVGPLLPTAENDSQQVLKKRHIGNDHLYIVYVDNNHDYNPSTISSQFGMMQIIVYPIRKTGLYRIEIFSRESEVPYFGPLRNGTVVQKKALPSLVRSTAIVTMMNFWCLQKEFFHPTIELASMIDELWKKHSVNDDGQNYKSIEELLSIRPS